MKEMRKSPEGDLRAKWEAASQWLSRFEDSDDWSIALMDGDRTQARYNWFCFGVRFAIALGDI